MSRKGNKLLTIPSGVNVTINADTVVVTGPKGSLNVKYPKTIVVTNENGKIKVSRKNEEKQTRQFHGTINSLINNALIGVSEGYTIKLNIVGVGYKAQVAGNKFKLAIGFSHPVEFDIPQGVKIVCPTPTQVEISGYDKIVVGEIAANIRAVRKPEPYNGKGIMYAGEHIIRKVGKTAEGAKK